MAKPLSGTDGTDDVWVKRALVRLQEEEGVAVPPDAKVEVSLVCRLGMPVAWKAVVEVDGVPVMRCQERSLAEVISLLVQGSRGRTVT